MKLDSNIQQFHKYITRFGVLNRGSLKIKSFCKIWNFYFVQPKAKFNFVRCFQMVGAKGGTRKNFVLGTQITNIGSICMGDFVGILRQRCGQKHHNVHKSEGESDFNTANWMHNFNTQLESVARNPTIARYVKNAPTGPRLHRGCYEGGKH